MKDHSYSLIHNKRAPFWALSLVVFGLCGLSSTWFYLGNLWNGYILDITGPAWNYILFRGLFTGYRETAWTQFWTPIRTLIIFIFVCFGIELLQYFKVYESTYDPWDFLAYISLLLVVFLMDYRQYLYKKAIKHQT